MIINNPKNNSLTNLRWATISENLMNKNKQVNNTSGVTGGVCWYKVTKKKWWQASITIDGINKHLGFFETMEQATEARLKAVNSIFKDYAHSSQKR